jgi:hypothetical protein
MAPTNRKFASLLLVAALIAPAALLAKKEKSPAAGMDEQKRVLHALNRRTFGPRPGEVQRVMAMGVDKWIDLQLHPEKIDDARLEAATCCARFFARPIFLCVGMPLYGCQPPTGYSMKSETWVNSSALLNRMNFARALAAGCVQGAEVSPEPLLSSSNQEADPQQVMMHLENKLLNGDVSRQTHETISKQLGDPQIAQRRLDDPVSPPNVGPIVGLLLGSPEFQRR